MNGIEHYLQQPPKGKRLGVLTNHATLTATGQPVALALMNSGMNVVKIFSPEHGITAQAEDGVKQYSSVDPYTSLPVISLYGDNFAPTEEQLQDVDELLIDVPNIGCRFYTYWWTVTYLLEAASKYGKEIVVLDRACYSRRSVRNSEGPMLDEIRCASFLGRWSMPLTFAFTLGELVKWFTMQRRLSLPWRWVKATALSSFQLPPSPALAEAQAIELYPGTCLFEGVNISVGRGTSFPFRVIGAPWINAPALHHAFRQLQLQGVTAVPYSFKPMWSIYSQEICHGLYFTVTDVLVLKPVTFGVALLRCLVRLYPQFTTPSAYPTAANASGNRHLDLLLGVSDAFSFFEDDIGYNTLCSLLPAEQWAEDVTEYLSSC